MVDVFGVGCYGWGVCYVVILPLPYPSRIQWPRLCARRCDWRSWMGLFWFGLGDSSYGVLIIRGRLV